MDTLIAILGTAGVTTLIAGFLSKGKNKAETTNIFADAYGKLIDELRQQVKFHGEQITIMQEREKDYIKIIRQHHEEKKALIERHTLIETELKGKIKELENKLADRIDKLENKFQ